MKKLSIIIVSFFAIIVCSFSLNGQTYQPFTLEERLRPLLEMNRIQNNAMKTVNELYKSIASILGEDIDSQLRKDLNAELKKLDNLSHQLSTTGYSASINKGFNDIYQSIQRDIASYNNRIAEKREKAQKEEIERSNAEVKAAKEPVDWSGTGFALNGGYIVTNYHVVDKANLIEVIGVNGLSSKRFSASVVATDSINDLAIIKIIDNDFPGFGSIPYAIKNQIADVGEDVWVLGYPLAQVLGNEIKLTNGIVSSRSGYQGDIATYQISAPIQPGNSGGPLFDSKGNIVGIVNAGVPGADNVGYAIKTSYLKNLADKYSLSSFFPTSNVISTLSLKDQVKKVNNYVFLLICSSKAVSNSYHPSVSTPSNISSSSSTKASNPTLSRSDGVQVHKTIQLSVPGRTALEWSSNDPSIASVDSQGLLTGNKAGKTGVWAKLSNNEYEHFIITVWENKSSTDSSNSPANRSSQPSSSISDIKEDAPTESTGGVNESVVISGTVRSSRNNAIMIGAKVTVSSTKVSTRTDSNGHYTIRASIGDVLIFSETFYESFQKRVGEERTIDVTLKRK